MNKCAMILKTDSIITDSQVPPSFSLFKAAINIFVHTTWYTCSSFLWSKFQEFLSQKLHPVCILIYVLPKCSFIPESGIKVRIFLVEP